MSLAPRAQKDEGDPVLCDKEAHPLCHQWHSKQHGRRLRDMRLSELEACAECFELEGWRDEEKEWLAEQARLHQSQSKVKFRQELIATVLLAQYRALEGNMNVTRAIEESAKLVVMPTLLHQVSKENRALLADIRGQNIRSSQTCDHGALNHHGSSMGAAAQRQSV